jgi:signal transduction histidine kinase
MSIEQLRAALPCGAALDDAAFDRRHRALLLVLAGHVPALGLLGLALAAPATRLGVQLGALAGLVLAGAVLRGRQARAVAVTLGLVACTAVLVQVTGGRPEALSHAFVVLGLVALYQDWRPLLVAVAGGITASVLAGVVVYGGLLLVAAAVVHVAFWHLAEGEQARARAAERALREREEAVAARLDAADAVKSELFAVVAHEFRTPLTSVIGYAHTLTARFGQLDEETLLTCLRSIEGQARRLEWLVHNILAASGEIAPSPRAVVDLAEVTEHALQRLGRLPAAAGRTVDLSLPAGLRVALDWETADRIVTNLLDNAVKFGLAATPIRVAGQTDGDQVRLEVANVAPPLPDDAVERIFDPFVQLDSSDSRPADGIGLGLHVVRRLVHAHGGEVAVTHDGARVCVSVSLPVPAARPRTLVLPDAERHRIPHSA